MSELDQFFELMGAVVRDGDDGVALARRFGESPSGRARVAHYATLVRRQHIEALDGFFAVLRAALAVEHAELWSALRDTWLTRHCSPARHPSGLGRAFAEWLSTEAPEERTAIGAVPLWAAELAHLACLQHEVAIAAPSPLGVARVASFTHDVVATLRSMASTPRVVVVPVRDATYALIHPDPETLRTRVVRIGGQEVAVLAWAAGEAELGMLEQLGITAAMAAATLARLQPKLGVFVTIAS